MLRWERLLRVIPPPAAHADDMNEEEAALITELVQPMKEGRLEEAEALLWRVVKCRGGDPSRKPVRLHKKLLPEAVRHGAGMVWRVARVLRCLSCLMDQEEAAAGVRFRGLRSTMHAVRLLH